MDILFSQIWEYPGGARFQVERTTDSIRSSLSISAIQGMVQKTATSVSFSDEVDISSTFIQEHLALRVYLLIA